MSTVYCICCIALCSRVALSLVRESSAMNNVTLCLACLSYSDLVVTARLLTRFKLGSDFASDGSVVPYVAHQLPVKWSSSEGSGVHCAVCEYRGCEAGFRLVLSHCGQFVELRCNSESTIRWPWLRDHDVVVAVNDVSLTNLGSDVLVSALRAAPYPRKYFVRLVPRHRTSSRWDVTWRSHVCAQARSASRNVRRG